jgi:putative membrane protein
MANGMNRRHDDASVARGIIAGTIGGLVASWLMTQFTTVWTRAVDGHESHSAGGEHDARDWQERSEDENATELVAQAAAERTIGRPLNRNELAVAAPIVHYGYGAAVGAVYGVLAEFARTNAFTGAAWGTLIWIVADEFAVPALGLSEPPDARWAEAHAQAFAAHIVYGAATDLVARATKAVM